MLLELEFAEQSSNKRNPNLFGGGPVIQNPNLSQAFKLFSEQASGSRMYQFLSIQISQDSELLELAKHARAMQPVANLFLAAVQFLLMQNPGEELASYYPSLGGTFESSSRMFQCFKEFCMRYEEQICKILKARLVQTNEVRRCALLFPALKYIAQISGEARIALVDVGASGGLNFLMDKVRIEYSDGQSIGPTDACVRIQCESKGQRIPSGSDVEIVLRIGIDLNPINLLEDSERMWNLALIWPDQIERMDRFKSAVQILDRDLFSIEKGNAIVILPHIARQIPAAQFLCIMHSFTLNQFSSEDRGVFEELLCKLSIDRKICRLGLEWIGSSVPELFVSQYNHGKRLFHEKVADCGGHGEWIRWRAPSSSCG